MKRIFCLFAFLCALSLSAQQPGMIYVEGGEFQTSFGEDVNIKSFYIDPYEVTIGDFKRFTDETGYITQAEIDKSSKIMGGKIAEGIDWRFNAFGKAVEASAYDVTPVCFVSYADILAYCAWAGKRLPREAEWEYAFREGPQKSTFKFSGSNSGKRVAVNEDFGEVKTITIGQKSPNALGIYDMSGNYSELCVADDQHIIIRGGSFVDDPNWLSYKRIFSLMEISKMAKDHSWYFGFRCVKDSE